ncbi:MAG: PE-PPE domain-containing protein [Mycobacterium sp.]|nr:PE-PPE domain-containing protein [Mycobacterium sp.]
MKHWTAGRVSTFLAVIAAAVSVVVVPTAGAATVLTLKETFGIGKAEMEDQLQGSLCPENTQQCVEVDYPATIGGNSLPPGVIALDTAIDTTSGQIIVLGYSQGAIVAGHWLQEHAADPDAPSTDELSFVLIGNPTRAFGGAYVPLGDVTPQTQYRVTDFAREYDFFADFPNKPTSLFYLLAIANAIVGIPSVHLNYTDVDPADPANAVWTVDNTTYILVPTDNLPLLQPLRMIGLGWVADLLDAPLRSLVDRAYTRPVPFPETTEAATLPADTDVAHAETIVAQTSAPPAHQRRAGRQESVTTTADTADSQEQPPAADPVSTATEPESIDPTGPAVADAGATPRPDRAAARGTAKIFRPLGARQRHDNAAAAEQSTSAPITRTARRATTNGGDNLTGPGRHPRRSVPG